MHIYDDGLDIIFERGGRKVWYVRQLCFGVLKAGYLACEVVVPDGHEIDAGVAGELTFDDLAKGAGVERSAMS